MTEPLTQHDSGSRTLSWAPVTTRSSGETLRLGIHTLKGAKDGPTLGLFSTSHGDEAFTIQVVKMVLDRINPAQLRGTIKAIPVGNPVAFESNTRTTGQGMNTDKNNLNRVFPGTPSGWLTEQMAHVITESFIKGLDYLIDYHCGTSDSAIDYMLLENDPSEVGRKSTELSYLYGTGLLYTAPVPEQTGTITQYAKSLGIPALIAQQGGNVIDPRAYLERNLTGVKNILIHLGMLDGEIKLPARQVMLSGARSILSPHHGGLFIPEVGFDQMGKTVAKGTVLGRVISAHSLEELEVLVAPYDETVLIMLRGLVSRVNPGDYAYILSNGATAEIVDNSKRGAA